LVETVAQKYRSLDEARAQAAEIRRATESAKADADFLKHAVTELSAIEPEEGEEEKLASERALLMNANRIAEDISAAVEDLSGDRGAETSIGAALKRLSRADEAARKAASTAVSGLEQAFAHIEEARRELESLLTRLEADPAELERKEERLFGLRAVARKYAVTVDRLPKLLAEFRLKLDTVQNSDTKLKQADAEIAKAHDAYVAVARKLSAARKTAAKKLEAAVASELAPLKLGHAKFRVSMEVLDEESASGLERVVFEVATIEGAPFGSLTKIASGGELARFSLALKVALSETNPPAALVFDEVDRGVGGAVADAVGERLQRLAKSTQVLLVTHAPQVAARADRHFRITRIGDRTKVHALSDDERREEIARMLSGAAVTDEARAAARRLMAEAETPPKKARKRA
jgi:DNA repair protein RecN (Recombination protein N)